LINIGMVTYRKSTQMLWRKNQEKNVFIGNFLNKKKLD